MRQSLDQDHPLRRMFSGTVQHVLYADVGMCDPQIADYLAQLLSSFIHTDDIYPFKDANGRRLEDLAEIATSAELKPSASRLDRERLVHQHIGDFALFWTGLFPEGVRRLRAPHGGPRLSDYMEQGKRSYFIVSRLSDENGEPPAAVFRRLSDSFEYCAYGLNRCRHEWEHLRERPEH